ncbi:glutathione S-transferase family protein [Candidatus Njordibacter sp. Uisw_039]|jgi:glutathione S-transferase|uniref:glutathione S-transferase family protein n=1 Tax=Candidatus Njordibacter sp. Uisw_039 TaxID=3230972 RepID=UPI003D5850CD
MNYKLFYASGSAAEGVRVIIEELGVPYELIKSTIDRSKQRPPEQLKINPNGWVPVLMYEDTGIYECAAITIFLCDRHSDAHLAPKFNDPTRGLYLQTLVYLSTSVQTAFQTYYYPDRFVDTSANEVSAKKRGINRLRETWKVIDDQIGDNDWVLGRCFSAVDIYLFMLTTWLNPTLGHPSTEEFPNIKRIAEAMMSRPSIQLVYAEWISENV